MATEQIGARTYAIKCETPVWAGVNRLEIAIELARFQVAWNKLHVATRIAFLSSYDATNVPVRHGWQETGSYNGISPAWPLAWMLASSRSRSRSIRRRDSSVILPSRKS